MRESHQAIVAKAFSSLWARIYNPRSACPDVELGAIEREMTEILQSLSTGEGTPEEQWVIAQLLLGPRTPGVLQWSWSEHEEAQKPVPKDPGELDAYFVAQENRVELAREAVTQAIAHLLNAGRIEWVDGEGAKKLRLL